MNTQHYFRNYLAKHRFLPAILNLPERPPQIIVVIPCYKEPALLRSLQSLYQCRRAKRFTEVIVVINYPDNASDEAKQQNQKSLSEARSWMEAHNDEKLHFHVIDVPDIPKKIAGVGLARKTGMDEAVYRFDSSGVSDGVIVGFDADSECDENYLEEIERTFFNGKNINGASVYYEHPIEGSEFSPEIYEGIILYELHLRYLNQALRHTGFPYAYHTIGSAFAVRAEAYVKQGGMNKRKAGEDFHFLQKIIPLGNYVEINQTRVIPSPRESDRVPFGTGAGIRRWINGEKEVLYTYPPEPIADLKRLFSLVPIFYKADPRNIEKNISSLSPTLQAYLEQNDYMRHLMQVGANSASPETFTKRFFDWFDGLQTVKYLNESCRRDYSKQPVEQAASSLLRKTGYDTTSFDTARELLQLYRKIERGF